MNKEAIELRRAYQRNWRKKNPEKVKQYVETFWTKKAESQSKQEKALNLRSAGMTQREIAKRLEVSLGTVNKWLNTDEHGSLSDRV